MKRISNLGKGAPRRHGASPVSCDKDPRFYVQSESVRGEGRTHWVVDRLNNHKAVTEPSPRRADVHKICERMNAKQ